MDDQRAGRQPASRWRRLPDRRTTRRRPRPRRARRDNYVTWETDFGDARTNYWHGVDLTVRARVSAVTLQGGTSTGRSITDTCATRVKIDSPDPRGCHNEEPFQTTFRGLASWTVPKIDVLVSGTLRSQPPVQVAGTTHRQRQRRGLQRAEHRGAGPARPPAAWRPARPATPRCTSWTTATTACIRTTAGRSSTCVSRRSSASARTRTDIGVDLYNLLNTNYALGYETTYSYTQPNGGTWQNPNSILPPRFARLNFTINY